MIPSLDSLPVGCFVTSLAREVRFANAFFQEDLGFKMVDLTGRSLDTLLTRASSIFYESYLHPALLTEGSCTEVSITVISGKGERIAVVANLRLLPGVEPLVIWCFMRAEKRDKIYEDLLKARETLQANAKRLEELAFTDDLTGLPNRREFEVRAEREIGAAERSGQPLVLALIDIDHFKAVNDSYGHAVGDAVLREFGQKLLGISGKGELVARYGGEEFMCCLSGTDAFGALEFARRVRSVVETVDVQGGNVTVSIGISIMQPGSGLDLAALIKFADLALYEAKATGRNRTVTFTEDGFISDH